MQAHPLRSGITAKTPRGRAQGSQASLPRGRGSSSGWSRAGPSLPSPAQPPPPSRSSIANPQAAPTASWQNCLVSNRAERSGRPPPSFPAPSRGTFPAASSAGERNILVLPKPSPKRWIREVVTFPKSLSSFARKLKDPGCCLASFSFFPPPSLGALYSPLSPPCPIPQARGDPEALCCCCCWRNFLHLLWEHHSGGPAPRAAPQRKCNIIARPQVPRLACPFPLPGMISTPFNTSLPKSKASKDCVLKLWTTTKNKAETCSSTTTLPLHTRTYMIQKGRTLSMKRKVWFHPCTKKLNNFTCTFLSQSSSPARASEAAVLPVHGTACAGLLCLPRADVTTTAIQMSRLKGKPHLRPGWNNENPGQKAWS